MKIELRHEYSTPEPDQLAAMAARGDYMDDSLVGTSYEDAMEDRDLQEYLEDKVYQGHFGVFEHPQGSFFVEGLSRSAMAQVTRHRHMSFDVQSQRYVDFRNKEPVIPPSFVDENAIHSNYWEARLRAHWRESVDLYTQAIEDGIPKEDARFFLPLATPVNMTLSANPRTLMHFFDLRRNAKAQWEARQFAELLTDVAHGWAPLTFNAYEEKTNNNSLRAP